MKKCLCCLGIHVHITRQFDGIVQSPNTILMNLYKRVFPKWTYQAMAFHQQQQQQQQNEKIMEQKHFSLIFDCYSFIVFSLIKKKKGKEIRCEKDHNRDDFDNH